MKDIKLLLAGQNVDIAGYRDLNNSYYSKYFTTNNPL